MWRFLQGGNSRAMRRDWTGGGLGTLCRAGTGQTFFITVNMRIIPDLGESQFCSDQRVCAASGSAVGALAVVVALPGLFWWWVVHNRDGKPIPMPPAMLGAGASVDHRLRLRLEKDKGAGIFAAARIASGTVLIRVPGSAVLSGERACNILGVGGLDGDVALCALLAEARRDAEAGRDVLGLREYLKALPAAFPTLPFSLAANARGAAEMRGTVLLPAAEALRDRSLEEREIAVAALGSSMKAILIEERWLWAKAVLLTRAGIVPGAQVGEIAIVPLIDFANCSGEPSAECQLGDDGEVNLVALKDLSRGSEVTISYGNQSQEQLLFTFGFRLPGAQAAATSPLPLESPELPVRNALLRFLALERQDEDFNGSFLPPLAMLKNIGEEIDVSELWAAANLLEADEQDLRKVASAVAETGFLPENIKLRATVAAQLRLQQVLEAWQSELNASSGKSSNSTVRRGDGCFAAVRAYRAECQELVEKALQRLHVEQVLASHGSGSASILAPERET